MTKGVVYSILASVLFGGLFMLAGLMRSMPAEDVFSWRVLISTPLLILMMLRVSGSESLKTILRRVRHHPQLSIWLLVSAAMLGVQLWLFMWAPLNGKALDVSLGYFMLPLSMVIAGRLGYKEKLSRLQLIATLCASVGVVNAIVRAGGVSWVALVISIGYPMYFYLRRRFRTGDLSGHVIDMILLMPVAVYFLASHGFIMNRGGQADLLLPASIVLLGVISAAAMMYYILAVGALPFAVFGLLSYIEPVLLLVVSLILGESIASSEWMTYVPIWIAVLILVVEGAFALSAIRRVGSVRSDGASLQG